MTRRYTSLGCGADVRSSWEDCPPPRDNPPSVRQSARHAGTELRPGTFSPRETYDSGFSVSAQSFNFLGSNFPITTRDWVSTHLTLSDSCPFRPTGRALADNPGPGPAVGWVRWNQVWAYLLRATSYDLRVTSNKLRLVVTPPLAVGPRSTPAGRTAWHPGTTLQVSGSRAGMLDQS